MTIVIGTLLLCILAALLYLALSLWTRGAFLELARITFAVALLVVLIGAGTQYSGCNVSTTTNTPHR